MIHFFSTDLLDILDSTTFGEKLNLFVVSEKDIPSSFLDEDRFSKQASSLDAPVRLCSLQLYYC